MIWPELPPPTPVPLRERFLVPAVVALVVVVVLALVGVWFRSDVDVNGLADGDAVKPAALGQVEIIPRGPDPGTVNVLLDGAAVPLRRDGNRIALDAPALPDGEHTLQVSSPDALLPLPGSGTSLEFTVDSVPPALTVDPITPTDLDAPAEVRGSVVGTSTMLADGVPVELDDDGGFTLPTAPGTAMVALEATDEAGNVTAAQVPIPVRHPGMRAVHMTGLAWGSAALREPILQMAAEGRIDTIQLDIKDESGEISYLSQVPMATEIGASRNYYDARAALDQLHAAGLRVVGRIVAFRDPVLGKASWTGGHHERLIQNANGTPWTSGYGQYSFTNFANPEVRGYNVALAAEAAELGFDEILYDYVRRPDGTITRMNIPGLTTTPELAIAEFLKQTRTEVRRHGALLGASVYGIAATRPTQIAQDIPEMSKYVDYVSPMVYPSHWGRGEYGVANPESQPYDITARSLADFETLAQASATSVIPWLQAFSLRVRYGPEEIRAQIDAAAANGISSFILWDANCRYPPAALDAIPKG